MEEDDHPQRFLGSESRSRPCLRCSFTEWLGNIFHVTGPIRTEVWIAHVEEYAISRDRYMGRSHDRTGLGNNNMTYLVISTKYSPSLSWVFALPPARRSVRSEHRRQPASTTQDAWASIPPPIAASQTSIQWLERSSHSSLASLIILSDPFLLDSLQHSRALASIITLATPPVFSF